MMKKILKKNKKQIIKEINNIIQKSIKEYKDHSKEKRNNEN